MVLYNTPLLNSKLRFLVPVRRERDRGWPLDGLVWASTDVVSFEGRDGMGAELMGFSATFAEVVGAVSRLADSDSAVLITGESGTGKEMVARAIHRLGRRSRGPFMVATRAAVQAHELETELFGREDPGPSAAPSRRGRFELAAGGTLFLDEVGGLKLSLQARIARLLKKGVPQPVGAKWLLAADARLIVATSIDLRSEVDAGRFLGELYSRLTASVIELPPLRERGDDVLLLAEYFAARYATQYGRPIPRLGPEAFALLYEHPWPGNIRELRAAMERAVLLAEGGTILPSHLIARCGSSG